MQPAGGRVDDVPDVVPRNDDFDSESDAEWTQPKRKHRATITGAVATAARVTARGVEKLRAQLNLHSFEVCVVGGTSVHKGIKGINFIHQLTDIKSAFNISDEAMKTLVKWITTKVLTWEHTLPTSWYKYLRLLQPRPIEDTRY